MKSQLDVLTGRRIVEARHDLGSWILGFGDASLRINNPVEIVGVEGDELPHGLEGKVPQEIVETKDSVIMHFEGGITLKIDLSEEAYEVPEAIVLVKPDGEFVVWR